MEKRGQLSIEYLTLVGFTLAIIAVLILVQFQNNEEQNVLVVSSQVDKIARTLVDAADEVYFLGAPARTTIKLYMPHQVKSIDLFPNALVVTIGTAQGISEIDRYSAVNLTGNISPNQGIKHIKVMAQEGRVCLLEEGLEGC